MLNKPVQSLLIRGEFDCYATFQGRMIKARDYVVNNTNNLLGINWMEKFDLWVLPINSYCKNVIGTNMSSNTNLDKLQRELKQVFSNIFSDKLGASSKTKAKFEIKENLVPIFMPKRNVPLE